MLTSLAGLLALLGLLLGLAITIGIVAETAPFVGGDLSLLAAAVVLSNPLLARVNQ
jgi:hypothetical protein